MDLKGHDEYLVFTIANDAESFINVMTVGILQNTDWSVTV